MTRAGKNAETALQPRSGLIGGGATRRTGCPPRRHVRPGSAGARQTGWHRHFLHGFAEGGMEMALARSGKGLGDAVLACLDDPAFRLELERISAGRLAAAEHKLVDLLLRRLDGPDETVEKSVLSIWQLLRDERRKPAAPIEGQQPQAARKARHTIPPERQAAALRAAKQAEEFKQLLEVIRTRLAAAEARKAAAT